jgi:hypothetical protein
MKEATLAVLALQDLMDTLHRNIKRSGEISDRLAFSMPSDDGLIALWFFLGMVELGWARRWRCLAVELGEKVRYIAVI